MLPREEILQRLHEYADEMQERFSLRRIGFFGSYVRRSADEESDIERTSGDSPWTLR
jgi:predicted nucleotidyltransferase